MSTIPSTARRKLAKDRADRLTATYSTPPIPVIEIAEQNDVDVIFTDFGEHQDTVAGLCDFNNAKLYVNKYDIIQRQLFTIAHELGHWLLHKDIFLEHPDRYPVLPRLHATDRSNVLEQEANHFAANLLVPERFLNSVRHAPVSQLASIFLVSKTMMEIRLK